MRLAIAHLEEQERKQDTLCFTEFQSKYQQAFSQPRAGVHNHDPASPSLHNGPGERDAPCDGETMETAAAGGSRNSARTEEREESELAEALERVSLSHTTTCTGSASAAGERKDAGTEMNNYFLGKHPENKAHFMDLLARTEHNPSPMRQKFKPNQ